MVNYWHLTITIMLVIHAIYSNSTERLLALKSLCIIQCYWGILTRESIAANRVSREPGSSPVQYVLVNWYWLLVMHTHSIPNIEGYKQSRMVIINQRQWLVIQGSNQVVGSFNYLSIVLWSTYPGWTASHGVRFFRQQLRIGVYEIHRRREVGPEPLDHSER